MMKSKDSSGVDPSSISQEVRDYCREPKNSTSPECTCINDVDIFANTINCAALKIKTCLTGKTPSLGEIPKECYIDWKDVASAKQNYDKEVREVDQKVELFQKCKVIYDGIQNAPWGDNAGPRLGLGNTRVEFGSVRRFCGKPAPAGSRTDIVQSQQPPPTYFKDAMSLPQCQLKGGIGQGKCCTPDFFNMNDEEAMKNGGLTPLETDYETNVLPGFKKKPILNQDYHIVKWTGWSKENCQCTSGVMDDGTVRPCAKACTGNAQIEFLASRAEMCGYDKEQDIYNYKVSSYNKNQEKFGDECNQYQIKEGNSLNCCVNAVHIGKDVSGNININQVCEIKGEKYNGAKKAADQEKKCKKNPDDPGCKKDCGPNQNCSGHGACVTDNDTGGKCKCGPDRSGKYCETCALTDSDCTTDNSYANREKCICECKPGYIGSVNAGVCVKDEKNKNIFEKIIDWYNSIPMKTKIVVLSGVTITTISIIILIVMISKSKTSAKLILK